LLFLGALVLALFALTLVVVCHNLDFLNRKDFGRMSQIQSQSGLQVVVDSYTQGRE
jgi:hypothetical protein